MFRKPKLAAAEAVKLRNAQAHHQVRQALSLYSPADRDRDLIEALIIDPYVCSYLPMSNFAVRYAAQSALIDAVLEQYARARPCSETRHFLFTAAFDSGFAFLGGPQVNLANIRRHVVSALRTYNLDAICAFEIDVLSKRLPDANTLFPEDKIAILKEHSLRLMFHVHAICWTRDPSFRPVAAAKDLMKRDSFSNALNVPAAHFTSRAMSCARRREVLNRPERDQTAWSMARMAQYMLKAPVCAKNYIATTPQRRGRLLDDAGAYGSNVALRMAEMWSHISASEAVFGVGEGALLAGRYQQSLRTWERGNRNRAYIIQEAELDDAWARLWAERPKLGYCPPLIRKRK